MKKIFSLLFLLFNIGFFHAANSQSLSGLWQGTVTQNGKPTTFTYQINITQKGDNISGTATSQQEGAAQKGVFKIIGTYNGNSFVFQEVEQLEPKNAKWCLKHARLTWKEKNQVLAGNWEATGCIPGNITLKKLASNTLIQEEVKELPLSQAVLGKWTGHLAQSDRDYGFYYEVNLKEGTTGTSYIVSEGNGGSANHALNWSLDEKNNSIELHETDVSSKTAAQWKWCLKNGTLRLKKDAEKYYLKGDWYGHLEGYSPNGSRGKCAPGQIYLEKPILKQQEVAQMQQYQETIKTDLPPPETPGLINNTDREIRIARTITVNRPQLRIRVWDNGTVDGDRVTVFLNERQLLQDFRVSKTKRAIPVTLAKGTNFLILHAENLGEITPNTVAVSIDDGTKEQILILSSNLETSGAVMIKQFEVKGGKR